MNSSPLWSLEYMMGRWRPEIGDPSFAGWFTAVAYAVGAVLAFSAARPGPGNDRRSTFFWGCVGLLMTLLAVNKQLDLQTLLTEMGRQIAQYQGWMEQRRTVQLWFTAGFSTLAAAVFLGFAVFMRNRFRRFLLAFIGLFFLLVFIVIRAAGIHHVDQILHFRIFHLRMNWILELTGIFFVQAAAVADIRRNHP